MKYIIIEPNGGLGNQMFQIANAINLSIKFNRKLLISKKNVTSRSTYWNTIFKVMTDNLISKDSYI